MYFYLIGIHRINIACMPFVNGIIVNYSFHLLDHRSPVVAISGTKDAEQIALVGAVILTIKQFCRQTRKSSAFIILQISSNVSLDASNRHIQLATLSRMKLLN